MLERIQERGLWILNGSNEKDIKGEYTQTCKGATVIDYAIIEEELKEDFTMRVGNRIESDHEELEIMLDMEWRKNEEEKEEDLSNRFVGDATWEERTWKEIVRLREDMFWARVGGIRG